MHRFVVSARAASPQATTAMQALVTELNKRQHAQVIEADTCAQRGWVAVVMTDQDKCEFEQRYGALLAIEEDQPLNY